MCMNLEQKIYVQICALFTLYILGVGIAGYLMIRYNHDTWLTIMIISQYIDSAIINIFLENPIMIHHDKQNACEKVKCKFSFFIQVQTVRKQQKKFCKSILTC